MSKHLRDGTSEPVSRDQTQAQPYSVRVPQPSQRDGYTHSNAYIPYSVQVWRMCGLTRERIAESVSRDQILRREWERGFFLFPFS